MSREDTCNVYGSAVENSKDLQIAQLSTPMFEHAMHDFPLYLAVISVPPQNPL